jgi:hypothetical protein
MITQTVRQSTVTMLPSELSILSVKELQSLLKNMFGRYKQTMGPLLYWLREKVKAKGKKGQGFGVWVEANLEDMSRDTADRWADEYAISQGLKPKPLGKMPKGSASARKGIKDQSHPDADPNDPHPVPFQLPLNADEEKVFLEAWNKLKAAIGEDKAVRLVFYAVVSATEKLKFRSANMKKPVQSVTKKQRQGLVN